MEMGWLKIHRKILNKGWAKDPDYLAVWIHLLMIANFEQNEWLYKGKIYKCNPGQLITSRKKLALISGVHRSKLERILSCFESEQQIKQQNMFTSRLITITNWNQYQQNEQQNEQQMSSKRAANEQQMSTIKESKNDKEGNNFNNNSLTENQQVEQKKEYGNKEINKMLEALKTKIGITAFVDSAIERNMAKHCIGLLSKIGKDEFVRRLDGLLADSFHQKNCNKIKYIYNNIKGWIEPTPTLKGKTIFIS